ncbi:Signal recognition particle receptor, alpha subunit [Trachipleistophora hominis]|uniref:Signal recognition particle receptor, alpha subunit n=1 Tax=Trachipleistophora hominis TaxID=72359 RepID=L7JTH5_TRAHO|nr:Signal recognition particle receptor, alpha subunit [Trachipleistophora hominis]
MLLYSTIFDLHGNVHHQSGTKPSYINNIIDTVVRKNIKHGELTVQGRNVAYRTVGKKVIMCVGDDADEQIERMAAEYLEDGAVREHGVYDRRAAVTKQEKRRRWGGTEKELDYSSTSRTVSYVPDTKSAFNLFNIKRRVFKTFDREALLAHLLNKNVAPEVAGDVLMYAESIDDVRDAMRSIIKTKRLGQDACAPYRVALVGTNGVGKTTTLSKLCYHFAVRDKGVYVAACDTFRAGAIEQLQTYVNRLKINHRVEIHQQGYNKEEWKVARSALQYGKAYDVILVDTAGRVNKKPLIDSLRKLTNLGFDDVVYVSEALKGYEKDVLAFDMVTAIIVTKIDTVDDRIGSILNLCYFSKKPVVFLGHGQSNVDLEEVDVEKVIETLLSE